MNADSSMGGRLKGAPQRDIPSFHQETLRRLVSLFQGLPSDHVILEIVRGDQGCSKLIAKPSELGASVITVFFYDDGDPQQVGVGAGKDTFLSLSTDIYGSHAQNWREFLEAFVRGVIEGTLVETLEYRGARLVRSTFTLRLGKEPFTFTRTNVPNWLKSLFKKSAERTICYTPYLPE